MSKDTIKKEKKDQKSNFMKELRAELKKENIVRNKHIKIPR